MNLFAKFARRCRAGNLVASDQTILLAVSGGVDSVVMLDLFVELSQRQAIKLCVAHIDHQLRDESAAEAKFVAALATERGLSFFSERISTRQYAREQKISLEMAARHLRYEALERLRRAGGADLIATAHTRSDQAETVLLRLLRGAGLAGLAGIAERRGNIIRPLLGFSREQIVEHAKHRCLIWREDPSNRDLAIPRNRLRHEVIPRLAEHFNQDLEATLARTAKIAREAHAYMKLQAEAALPKVIKEESAERIVLDIQQIKKYNRRIHAYLLRLACARVSGEHEAPSHRHIERARNLIAAARVGARQSLGDEIELLVDRDGIVLRRVDQRLLGGEVEVGVPFRIAGTPWQLLIADELWGAGRSFKDVDDHSQYVDAATIKGRLRVRWPQAGDAFYPLGMQHPKKVHDFFADMKVPIRRRTTTPLLECEAGIVWVCGFRIDDRFKVTESTKQVLHLQLIP
jgi:tRNA(Ile)-lysidine synthase